MAATKLLLLVLWAIAQQYGVTPPNARPAAEQLLEQRGVERIIPWIVPLSRVSVWTWAILEASVLLALSGHCPPTFAQALHHLLPTALTDPSSPLAPSTTPTPAFLAGTLLTLAGALLRAHCYRALGRYFTFELAIRPAHTLVTHGVYGVVRHPSYTGVLALVLGMLLCALDPRGLVVSVLASVVDAVWMPGGDVSARAVIMAVLTCAWATTLGVMCVGMSRRMDEEDAMLERNFGEAWRAWAKRVPYRLVPGVY